MRAPEWLISSLGSLGRGGRRRRRVLCVFVCLFVCVFVRWVGRRRAGRDPPTKETLRFCPFGWVTGGPAATHPQRKPQGFVRSGGSRAGRPRPTHTENLKVSYILRPTRDPPATHPIHRRDPPVATHPRRPTRRALTLIGEGRALGNCL